jgi:ABC-2 type transport system ATP-binding protein
MNALEIRSLVKRYGSIAAVSGLDLDVPAGTVFGFLGPNGAGKTTTLRMVAGLSAPTSGTIRLFDRPVHFGSHSGRERIGYLPDVPECYAYLKPVEFLRLCADLCDVDRAIQRVRIPELLELVGLEKEKRRIGGFSRGMKQRLGIAQALVNAPDLVMLDEPASALDPAGRKDVMDVIGRLSERTTVFFSTHILADVERVCDRVAILVQGRCVVEDSIDGLRRRYALDAHRVRLAAASDGIRREEANRFALRLSVLPWCGGVQVLPEGDLIVTYRDLSAAQRGILVEAVGQDLPIERFEPVEPSLESIFMKVVGS